MKTPTQEIYKEVTKLQITVFGSGYVGLVTAACLADCGHNVICLDVDKKRINDLKSGIIPIFEPGLEQIVISNMSSKQLQFSIEPQFAVEQSEILFIAVGTPQDEDGSADLRHVLTVAATIGDNINDYKLVVNKSTVPVGTADEVRNVITKKIKMRGLGINFDVCSNPEFLKEGDALNDFMHGARIVVGVESQRAFDMMAQCYYQYSDSGKKLIKMDARSAELTKYAANAMLATKISFINEIANLAEKLGANIDDIRAGIGTDPRIGFQFINPGCGYGGSCFPKDVSALKKIAENIGHEMLLLNATDQVNKRQKKILFEKLAKVFDGNLDSKVIGIWGLSFKPETDDMREAPSLDVIKSILNAGGFVKAYDPEAKTEALRIFGYDKNIELVDTKEAAISGVDALVICTEWMEFSSANIVDLSKKYGLKIIVDGRNIYKQNQIHEANLSYLSIGRVTK